MSSMANNILTDSEIESIIIGVYVGRITTSRLPLNLYKKIAELLTKAVFDGYGENIINVEFGTPDYTMLSSLVTNVYMFSGAKTYQEIRTMVEEIVKNDKVVPFNEFRNSVLPKMNEYNLNWMETEYNTAKQMARSSSLWQDIQSTKKLYPFLQYVTVGDGLVRPSHQMLDGIIRPVDDAFWNTYYPPCDWNCRCHVIQLMDSSITNLSNMNLKYKINPEFAFNPGKKKIIFSPKHTYFKVAKEDKLLAKRNFDLPLPNMRKLNK